MLSPWYDLSVDPVRDHTVSPTALLAVDDVIEILAHKCHTQAKAPWGRAIVKIVDAKDNGSKGRLVTAEYLAVESKDFEKHLAKKSQTDPCHLHFCLGAIGKCAAAPRGESQLMHVSRWRFLTNPDISDDRVGWLKGKATKVAAAMTGRPSPAGLLAPGPSRAAGDVDGWLSNLKSVLGKAAGEGGADLKRKLQDLAEVAGSTGALQAAGAEEIRTGAAQPVSKRPREDPNTGDFFMQGVGSTNATPKPSALPGQTSKASPKELILQLLSGALGENNEAGAQHQPVFQLAPSLGSQSTLQQMHQKSPGRLAVTGLQTMETILGQHREGEASQQQVPPVAQAFFHQITYQKFGNGDNGRRNLRSLRELQTLSVMMDHMARQQFGAACDVAIQRMKAIEKSLIDGHWTDAQHLELLPSQAAGLVQRSEERMASREARQENWEWPQWSRDNQRKDNQWSRDNQRKDNQSRR